MLKQVPQLAKKARVYDGTAWQELASAQTDLTAYSTTAQMNTAIAAASGFTLINTTTFSASSSVSLPLNSFTSTYDNYKIYLNISAASATPGYSVRFRAAGADSSAATYNYYTRLSSSSSGADTNTFARSQTSGVLFPAGTGTDLQSYVIDVMSPKLSQFTSLFFSATGVVGNHIYGSIVFNNTTSFDSLSVFPSTGNFTGTVSVYGISK